MMKRAALATGILAALCLVYGLYAWHTRIIADPLTRQLRARAFATSDNPILARQVIVDGIYAKRTLVVAVAYHQAMLEKPLHEARVANFAHAAAVVDNFVAEEEFTKAYAQVPEFKNISSVSWDVLRWGRQAAKSLIEPPDEQDVHNEVDIIDKINFKPTRIADAWLAWATFCGDDKEMSLCFQKAQKLDPTFGEAYYQPISLGFVPDGRGGFLRSPTYEGRIQESVRYRAFILAQLAKAEQLEPSLHPLVIYQKYLLAYANGNAVAAAAYLKEYVRLWPSAFAGRDAALAQTEEAIHRLKTKH